jgi:predicted nucleotidyltransferase component of viral defense system
MKDYVLELVAKQATGNEKLNTMREYLQAYLLRALHEYGFFHNAAFVGGTALRFLYDLPRFSEDLDFSMEILAAEYSFADLVKKVKDEFLLAGYSVSATYNDNKTVQHAFIKFSGLMYETGISQHREQNFSIKIEIDTKPPKGAETRTVIINKYFPISFLSYDNASLFAGKLHALINRKYTKGRDFFDIGWYISKWPDISPNITLLQNALKQTGWQGQLPTSDNWRSMLYGIIEKTDWEQVIDDVEPFLERPSDLKIFSRENILTLISEKK